MRNAFVVLGALYLRAIGVVAVLLAICVGIEYWGRAVRWWYGRRHRRGPARPLRHDARDAQLARDTEIVRRALEKANRPTRAPQNRATRRLTIKTNTITRRIEQ